ncbi:MAG: polysaccharide deacetylase family protein [Clostridiaceae bacterium]
MNTRRNRILIRKLKKRRRKRILGVASVLVLLISLMTYVGIKMLNRDNQNPQSIASGMTPVEETPLVETINESSDPKDEEVKPETVATAIEFIKGVQNSSFSIAGTLPKKIDFDALYKGGSYSIRALSYAYDTDEVKAWMRGTIEYHGPKIAFLTFDDGPGKYTPAILDLLKEKKVPATFFILGKSLTKAADKNIMHRYIKEGHAIANHSYSHDYSYMYPGRTVNTERVLEEYQKALNLMKETLGNKFNTTVFRYPGGSGSWSDIEPSKAALAAIGVKFIDWNSMSGDAEPKNRRPSGNEALSDYVLTTINKNRHPEIAVVLMHDSLEVTPGYIGLVIDKLRAQGYQFGILK